MNLLIPAKNGEKREIARFELGRDAGLEDGEG